MAAAYAAFNITDTIVSGAQALYYGAPPGRVLGAIGMSIALNILIPAPTFENLFIQVAFHAARGAFISTATTAAIQGGGKLGPAAAWGGGMGAFGGFLGSQQFTNWTEGHGFRSNNVVIDAYVASGDFQAAVDYARAKYNINEFDRFEIVDADKDPYFIQSPDVSATTYPDYENSNILQGVTKVSIRSASKTSRLQSVLFHEGIHVQQIRGGKMLIIDTQGTRAMSYNAAEVEAYSLTLKNAHRLNLRREVINEIKGRLKSYQE